MTAQVYSIISISSFILSGIMLFVSIFLFFKLKMKAVIGELSGKTAAKQVEEIRRQNRAVKKRASVLMGEENKEPDVQPQQVRRVYVQSPALSLKNQDETNLLGEETSLLSEETEVLQEETTILGTADLSSDIATTVLNETVVLQNERDDVATTLLYEVREDEEYVILDEIMEIHTQEVIKG